MLGALVLMVAGCRGEVVAPGDASPLARTGAGETWNQLPRDAALTIGAAGDAPPTVIRDAERVEAVLTALPPAVRLALIRDGSYECADPVLARACWQAMLEALDEPAAKRLTPALDITKSSWGKIKLTFGA
jgi:hypothetical protein